MDVRSLRMLLGWSREELAKRSNVLFASVYLLERMGTAGPNDDALITRVLLEAHRRKSPKLLLGNDAVLLQHANDNATTMPAIEPRSGPASKEAQRSTPPRGNMDQSQQFSFACAGGPATSSSKCGCYDVGGVDCR